MARDEGILRRWSRRKLEVRRQEERTPEADTPGRPAEEEDRAAPPNQKGEPAAGTSSDDIAGQEDSGRDLPDLDSLDKDSDYSVFMREDVPEAMRNQALRKLWMSDPAFGKLDGLVEYGEDYTDAATVVEGMKSTYQAGLGYLREAEDAAPAEASEETADAEQPSGSEPDDTAERAASNGERGEGKGSAEVEPKADMDTERDAPDTKSRRRGS